MPALELTDDQVIKLLNELPLAQQLRVMARFAATGSPRKQPRFGSARNDILFIADDFDAPLEDFKEYMEVTTSILFPGTGAYRRPRSRPDCAGDRQG